MARWVPLTFGPPLFFVTGTETGVALPLGLAGVHPSANGVVVFDGVSRRD